MSYEGIMAAREKDQRKDEVKASGTAEQIAAYSAAEKKEIGAMAGIVGSLWTLNPVTGAKATMDYLDANKEQHKIHGEIKK